MRRARGGIVIGVMASVQRPQRVLIGDLDFVANAGMVEVFSDGGIEVVSAGGGDDRIVAEARRVAPDAIVLDLDGTGSRALADRLRRALPGATVVLWPRDESRMHVLDPGCEPRVVAAASDGLLEVLNRARES